eukprot:1084587-Rhodomonas_salina.1
MSSHCFDDPQIRWPGNHWQPDSVRELRWPGNHCQGSPGLTVRELAKSDDPLRHPGHCVTALG